MIIFAVSLEFTSYAASFNAANDLLAICVNGSNKIKTPPKDRLICKIENVNGSVAH